jgi:O-antigen ligase
LRLVIHRNKMLLFLLLLPFFTPDGMTTIGVEGYIINASFLNNRILLTMLTGLYRVRNLIGIMVLVLVALNFIKRNTIKLIYFNEYYVISVAFCVYAIWTLISVGFNGHDMYVTVVLLLYCSGYLFLVEGALRKNPQCSIDVLCFITQLLLCLNLILIFFFPNGITSGTDYLKTPYYFLGTKNQITPFLILSLLLVFLQKDTRKSNRKMVVGICLVVGNALWMSSATSLLTVFFMLIIIWFRGIEKAAIGRNEWFNGKVLIGIVVFVSVGIVFFNVQNIFKWLIVDIFQKDLSFSGRTETWRLAIEQIKDKWIIGYGYGHMVIGHYYAHNAILELLVTTGCVGAFLYIRMIWKVVKSVLIKRKNNFRIIMVITVVTMLMANITEAFLYNISQLTIFAIAYHWYWIRCNFKKTSDNSNQCNYIDYREEEYN